MWGFCGYFGLGSYDCVCVCEAVECLLQTDMRKFTNIGLMVVMAWHIYLSIYLVVYGLQFIISKIKQLWLCLDIVCCMVSLKKAILIFSLFNVCLSIRLSVRQLQKLLNSLKSSSFIIHPSTFIILHTSFLHFSTFLRFIESLFAFANENLHIFHLPSYPGLILPKNGCFGNFQLLNCCSDQKVFEVRPPQCWGF